MWEDLTKLREEVLRKRGVSIDNEIFGLHYRYTLISLALFSVIITSGQYIGDPIECFSYGKDVPAKALDYYCWVQTTFILPKALDKKVGVEVIAPGIDSQLPGDEKVYIKYYQWVGLFLAFQATMFYITRFFWKALENGKVEGLVLDFRSPVIKPAIGDPPVETMYDLVAGYLFKTRKHHNFYFWKFFACEILNVLNVIFQIYLVDHFLDGEFTQYGSEVVKFLNMNQEDRVDPMIKVFPRVTKCTFHKFGPTGNIHTLDAFCVLPLNILNEKVFVFFWFWFILLGLLSGVVILYRFALICSSWLRKYVLQKSFAGNKFEDIIFEESIGYWLLMKRLAKNSDHLHFQNVLDRLTPMLEDEKDKLETAKQRSEENKKLLKRNVQGKKMANLEQSTSEC